MLDVQHYLPVQRVQHKGNRPFLFTRSSKPDGAGVAVVVVAGRARPPRQIGLLQFVLYMFHPSIIPPLGPRAARSKVRNISSSHRYGTGLGRRWTFGPGAPAAGRRTWELTFRSDRPEGADHHWELVVTVADVGPLVIEDRQFPVSVDQHRPAKSVDGYGMKEQRIGEGKAKQPMDTEWEQKPVTRSEYRVPHADVRNEQRGRNPSCSQ